MKALDKAIFPSLLNRLWIKLKPENAIAGFVGSGLHPINPEKVKPRVVESGLQIGSRNTDSSRKMLRQAKIDGVTPSPSEQTKRGMENSNRKRKRVEAKNGEVRPMMMG